MLGQELQQHTSSSEVAVQPLHTRLYTMDSTHPTNNGLGVLSKAARKVNLLPKDVVKELIIRVPVKGRLHRATADTSHASSDKLTHTPPPPGSQPLTLPTIISYMRMPSAHQSTDMPYGR